MFQPFNGIGMAQRAQIIATIAHGARGQKRADGITPYIVHPRRVANLVHDWHNDLEWFVSTSNESCIDYTDCVCAAYLHDVVEDTKLTLEDLLEYGMYPRIVEIVDLLTKKNAAHEPESKEYYELIMQDKDALFVKAADRCANLEDVVKDIMEGRSIRRWERYVDRTYDEVLPHYEKYPFLHGQLLARLKAVETELGLIN
jgi:(p)ppGpp synthase/HD superfamily hydrolase